MLVPIEWLKELVEIDWSVQKLAEALTLTGLKVEGIFHPFAQGNIVCAEVVETSVHSQSNKLKICKVYDGKNVYTTVTSDMKVEKGSKIPLALPSTKLANSHVVEPANIKGVTSEAVMCSLEELGLEPKSDGVCLIGKTVEDVPLGADILEYWKLKDPVLDIEVTPNRPDCLGIIGVAREIGALTGQTIRKPQTSYPVIEFPAEKFIKVRIEDTDGCPRYCAAFIQNVNVRPSPIWIKRRLMACGIRPINNLVDSTNYVMLETGHPTHAFDYEKIYDATIIVRKAKAGERVKLLDEKDYELKGQETLIADPKDVLAIGGVMGAMNSGVTDQTTQVLLEVAYFNPVRIRKTSKSLNIKSDAAYRFERGVDPNDVPFVMKRLLTVLSEISGAVSANGFVDCYPGKMENRVVTLRKQKISSILGVDPGEETNRILRSLEMQVEDRGDIIRVTVPTFRPDISIEEDLIEEVGRIYGYSKVEPIAPRILVRGRGWNEKQLFRKKLREHLLSLGFDETINLSFCSSKLISKLMDVKPVKLINPLSEDMDSLRPSLLFGLIDSLAFNYRRQMRDLKYFEIAKVFHAADEGIIEKEYLGMIATGRTDEDNYRYQSEIDFHIFKGYLDSIANHFGLDLSVVPINCSWFTPGRSAVVKIGNLEVGKIGMLANLVLENYDLKDEIYFLELDFDSLFCAFQPVRPVKNLSSFPAVRRDVSLLLPIGVYSGGIINYLLSSNEYVETAGVCDVYKGKDVPDNMRSVTFYVVYRASDRSLTDEEVNKIFEKTITEIEQRFGVKRRFS